MSATITQFPEAELEQRIDADSMEAFDGDNLPHDIDCADERPFTRACQDIREGEIPARHFGAASGIAIVTLKAIMIEEEDGATKVAQMLKDEPLGIAGIAAKLSNSAYESDEIRIHQHSAENIENHRSKIRGDIVADLGCAYNASLGTVMNTVDSKSVRQTAKSIAHEFADSEIEDDIVEAIEANNALMKMLGGEATAVTRAQMRAAISSPLITPIAMVKGDHIPSDQATAVIDLASYASKQNGREYHHSVALADMLHPHTMPEHHDDLTSHVSRAASLVAGVATAHALNVLNFQVIPEESAGKVKTA